MLHRRPTAGRPDTPRPGRAALRRAIALLLAALPGTSRAAEANCHEVVATVKVAWAGDRGLRAAGVVTRVGFPPTLRLPVEKGSASVAARTERLGPTQGGLFDAIVRDSDGDGRQDRVNVGLVTSGIPAGDFVRIRFECTQGAAPPAPGDFSCVAEVSDGSLPVDATCSVEVASGAPGKVGSKPRLR